MFHPTVFDNLKVSIENQLYDYDNLDGALTITGRSDLLDLATLSREFRLSFRLAEEAAVTAELVLRSSLKDLSDEILDLPDTSPGCSLLLRFAMLTSGEPTVCLGIERILAGIWGEELAPVQTLSFTHPRDNGAYKHTAEIAFKRPIHEDQMEDLPELLACLLQSTEQLEQLQTAEKE